MKISDFRSKIVVQKNPSQLWNFYICNDSIFYMILNNNIPSKKIKLTDNIQSYDIALDSKDNIHLICVKKNGELCYFLNSNNNWKKKIFKKSNSKCYIDFVNILNINKTIHIFYAYRSSISSKFYKVFHIHSLNNHWKYIYTASVMLLENTRPYFVDYRKSGDIFFLYKSNSKNKGKVYVKVFNHKSCKWSSITELNLRKDSTVIKNFLIDSKNNFHFLYGDNGFTEYLNSPFKKPNDISKFNLLSNPTGLINIENACCEIFEAENTLWISWNKEDILHYIYSKDYGESWSEKEEFECSDLYKVKYVGVNYKDLNIEKPLITFGVDRSNLMYLLGMDSDFLKEEDIETDIVDSDIDKATQPISGDDEIIVEDEAAGEEEIIDENEVVKEEDQIIDEDEVVEEDQIIDKEAISEDECNENTILQDTIIDNEQEIIKPQDEKIEENVEIEPSEEAVVEVKISEEIESKEEKIKSPTIPTTPTKKSLIEKLKDFLINN